MITPQSRQMIRLYKHYEKGVMPFSGGLLEQPNIYLQSMDVIEDQLA